MKTKQASKHELAVLQKTRKVIKILSALFFYDVLFLFVLLKRSTHFSYAVSLISMIDKV